MIQLKININIKNQIITVTPLWKTEKAASICDKKCQQTEKSKKQKRKPGLFDKDDTHIFTAIGCACHPGYQIFRRNFVSLITVLDQCIDSNSEYILWKNLASKIPKTARNFIFFFLNFNPGWWGVAAARCLSTSRISITRPIQPKLRRNGASRNVHFFFSIFWYFWNPQWPWNLEFSIPNFVLTKWFKSDEFQNDVEHILCVGLYVLVTLGFHNLPHHDLQFRDLGFKNR